MSFDLNELRAQRERVREHLAWLDRQIEQVEGPSPIAESKVAPEEIQPQSTNPTLIPVDSTVTSATKSPIEYPTIEFSADLSPGGFGSSSKAGCILVSIGVVALIIFLLFGLPYLLPVNLEKDNQTLVTNLETQISKIETQEDKDAAILNINRSLNLQRNRLKAFQEQGLDDSEDAQITLETIEKLEALHKTAQSRSVFF